MPLGGLIVNRVHVRRPRRPLGRRRSRRCSRRARRPQLAGRVAGNLADFDVLARRDRESIEQLSARARTAPRLIVVPQLDEDVQDLLGLGRVAEHLLE